MLVGLIVFLVSMLVSPIGLALVVMLVERRPFVLTDQYMAFLVGDVLLAAAAGAGFSAADNRPLWSWWLLVPLITGVIFGRWQTGHEVAKGVYSYGEAYSPSKLYHQFVCYPILATLLCRSLYFARDHWAAITVVVVLIVIWGAANVWDWSHPKSPHQDFDWSTFSTADRSDQ